MSNFKKATNSQKISQTPSLSSTSTKNTDTNSKASTRISKEPKLAYSTRALDKQKKESLVEKLNLYLWQEILSYCITSLDDLMNFTKVCKRIYQSINQRESLWVHLIYYAYKKELSKNQEMSDVLKNRKYNFQTLIEYIKQFENERINIGGKLFLENYNKLFTPGHIKENISSKIINCYSV